eukprot:5694840-Alexandrium_andersonii.AAC.1
MRAQSFIEALHFCAGTLGLKGVDELLSPRVRGSAQRAWMQKRLTRKDPPVPARWVAKLEELVCNADSLVDRVLCGF